jgi:hypothetical protein
VDSSGDARVAITATKVYTALHGSMTATVEAVVDVLAVDTGSYGSPIVSIKASGASEGLVLQSSNPAELTLIWHGGANIATWAVPLSSSGRIVLHAVLDTTQASAPARTMLYVNGAPSALSGGQTPAQNATIDLTAATAFVVGSGVTSSLSIAGNIYYLAMYSSALSASEVAANAALLQGSDDAPP